jgi:hypothetical protein
VGCWGTWREGDIETWREGVFNNHSNEGINHFIACTYNTHRCLVVMGFKRGDVI